MITDLSYLKTITGGDPKFIREMIDLFREQIQEYKSIMPDLLEKKDYDSLSKIAHKAKSSVADLLKELEILANEQKEVERYKSMVSHFLEQSELALVELEDSN